jgi:hypothetical protein
MLLLSTSPLHYFNSTIKIIENPLSARLITANLVLSLTGGLGHGSVVECHLASAKL